MENQPSAAPIPMQPETQAKLVIWINPDGTVAVNGPLDNKMLCYGLLDCARDAIKDFNDNKNKSAIVVPRLNVLGTH